MGYRIAFVNVGDAPPNAVNVAAFRRGLADLGYGEGRNIAIDFAWGGQNGAAMPRIATEALRRNPRVAAARRYCSAAVARRASCCGRGRCTQDEAARSIAAEYR